MGEVYAYDSIYRVTGNLHNVSLIGVSSGQELLPERSPRLTASATITTAWVSQPVGAVDGLAHGIPQPKHTLAPVHKRNARRITERPDGR